MIQLLKIVMLETLGLFSLAHFKANILIRERERGREREEREGGREGGKEKRERERGRERQRETERETCVCPCLQYLSRSDKTTIKKVKV